MWNYIIMYEYLSCPEFLRIKKNGLMEYSFYDRVLMIFIAEEWTQNLSLVNSSDTFVDSQPLGDKLLVRLSS